MLPTALESRAEEVFYEIGGLAAARNYFTEEEITDICLFNGFTEILFPYYQPFLGTLEGGLYDYKSLDLTTIDYAPGGHLCVTDKYYKPLYNVAVSAEVIDGKLSYYFGKTSNDKDFLANCRDGQLLYLMYKTSNSVGLTQIIVSHKLPRTVVELNRNRWDTEQKRVRLDLTTSGELNINNPSSVTVTVFKVEADIKNNLSENDIVYGNATQTYALSDNRVYLKISRDSWICIREYSMYVEPDIFSINDQQELNNLLTSRGYALAANTKDGYVMTKTADGYVQEVIVTVEENNIIDSVNCAKFKRLGLTNIEGLNTGYIKSYDNVYYLEIKETHARGGVSSEPGIINKSTFKVDANLTYV